MKRSQRYNPHRLRRMRRMRHRHHGWHHRGPGARFGGRRLMSDFLAENPDVAERLVAYGVAKLREEGVDDDEIREHFAFIQERGFAADIDIDQLLA